MTVSAGSSRGVCVLEIVNDLKREAGETMEVSITDVVLAPGALGSPNLGDNVVTVVTIIDDDGTYSFAVSLSLSFSLCLFVCITLHTVLLYFHCTKYFGVYNFPLCCEWCTLLW